MKVFWVSGSPYSWRVLLALQIKGLAFHSRMLGDEEGGLDSPELRSINPYGTVPTLVDGDLVLTDSIGILFYLDRLKAAPPLFGESPIEAGTIWQRVFAFVDHFEAHSKAIVKTFYAGEAESCRAGIADDAVKVRGELARIEARFSGTWMVGESLTAADLVSYPFLKSLFRAAGRPEAQSHLLELLPVDRRFPAIAAWMARIEALPGYDRTYPPGWIS